MALLLSSVIQGHNTGFLSSTTSNMRQALFPLFHKPEPHFERQYGSELKCFTRQTVAGPKQCGVQRLRLDEPIANYQWVVEEPAPSGPLTLEADSEDLARLSFPFAPQDFRWKQ